MSILSAVKKCSSLITILLLFPNFVFANIGDSEISNKILLIPIFLLVAWFLGAIIIFLCMRYTLTKGFGVIKSTKSWWKIFGLGIFIIAPIAAFVHIYLFAIGIELLGIQENGWYLAHDYSNPSLKLYDDIIGTLWLVVWPYSLGLGVYFASKLIK